MRAPLFIFSFTSSIQVEISAQLPACKDSFPSSLLLNNSFEDYSGCNTMTTIEGGVIDAPAAYAATSETYTVPEKKESEGNYAVNIGQPYNTCLNTLPFPVTFSEVHDFSLGNDTLLCAPSTVTLNAGLQTAVNYLWQDGSGKPTLDVDKQVCIGFRLLTTLVV